jgi:hypothetical protein
MAEPAFKNFDLVGGTSLSLQIGHRLSVDIDLFGHCEIDEDLFMEKLNLLGSVQLLKKSANILICSVNGIKVDFVNYAYPTLSKSITIDSIRLASKEDILAMKLNAIAGRGSRKDFIDLYFLLNEFSLDAAFSYYSKKYSNGSEFLVRKSLTFFEDAEKEEMPTMLNDVTWDTVKDKILSLV